MDGPFGDCPVPKVENPGLRQACPGQAKRHPMGAERKTVNIKRKMGVQSHY